MVTWVWKVGGNLQGRKGTLCKSAGLKTEIRSAENGYTSGGARLGVVGSFSDRGTLHLRCSQKGFSVESGRRFEGHSATFTDVKI